MVRKHIFNLKSEAGITLAEVIVSIAVVALFSVIMIVNFPQIQRRYALSNAAYAMAQALRKAQDLALSGVGVKNGGGDPMSVNRYGVYIDRNTTPTKYIIYANIDSDKIYNPIGTENCLDGQPYNCCSQAINKDDDCVVEVFDMSKQNSNLKITNISNIGGKEETSISFTPPNPTIDISDLDNNATDIVITLGLTNDSSLTRTVYINKAGLINVQ